MTQINTIQPKRFDTEAEAKEYARKRSEDHDTLIFVTESARPSDPERGRFVVDTDSFCRNWERRVAAYFKGQEDPLD